MRYLLATAAYSNPELLEKCVSSWPTEGITKCVFLDKGPQQEELEKLTWQPPIGKNFYIANDHLGVSGSWNALLDIAFGQYKFDAIIIVGSDTEMQPGFVEGFIADFESQKLEFACAYCPIGWNCWIMTKKCYETVGRFDESFSPAYFEDNDYGRRVFLSGLPWGYCGDASLMSHYGSATIRLSERARIANAHTFSMNKAYFVKKWGGEPGAETFDVPFNNPENDLKFWELDMNEYNLKKELWA